MANPISHADLKVGYYVYTWFTVGTLDEDPDVAKVQRADTVHEDPYVAKVQRIVRGSSGELECLSVRLFSKLCHVQRKHPHPSSEVGALDLFYTDEVVEKSCPAGVSLNRCKVVTREGYAAYYKECMELPPCITLEEANVLATKDVYICEFRYCHTRGFGPLHGLSLATSNMLFLKQAFTNYMLIDPDPAPKNKQKRTKENRAWDSWNFLEHKKLSLKDSSNVVEGLNIGDTYAYKLQMDLCGLHRPYSSAVSITDKGRGHVASLIFGREEWDDHSDGHTLQFVYAPKIRKNASSSKAKSSLQNGVIRQASFTQNMAKGIPLRVWRAISRKGINKAVKRKEQANYKYEGHFKVTEVEPLDPCRDCSIHLSICAAPINSPSTSALWEP